jgi:hypothetical protein
VLINSDLSIRHIVRDRVNKSKRAVEALDYVLEGRGILIDVRTSVLKTCVLPLLTYECKVWRMDTTNGSKRLQIA